MNARELTKSPVGKRLREARTTLGISQKKLGILAGIDEFAASPRINQYERDKHVPDFATAKRLAKVLKIPVAYLFTDEDELAKFILLFGNTKKTARARILRLLTEI